MILESEDLHRVAYNATFQHFHVKPNGKGDVADWSVQFYDDLQNRIGGGKPKMRWYFGKHSTLSGLRCPLCAMLFLAVESATLISGKFGWPSSTVLPTIPETEEEKTSLINTLQDWKTNKYQKMIGEASCRCNIINTQTECSKQQANLYTCMIIT